VATSRSRDSKTASLFYNPPDPVPLARRTHPEESKAAARHIVQKLGDLQAEVLAIIKEYPGHTVSELARIWRMRDPRHIGRRLPELASQGFVYKVGSRKCEVTGRSAAVWAATR